MATQELPIAYAKTVRVGRYTTESLWGKMWAPPEAKGECLIPGIIGIVTAASASLFFPELVGHEIFGSVEALNRWIPPAFVGGAAIATIVGCFFAIQAARYNISDHALDRLAWENSKVCHECGHVFVDPEYLETLS